MGSTSVSRGGRSRSGGGEALSWRDRLTREGEGKTKGKKHTHTHAQAIKAQITHKHTHRGMGGKKRGKIKDKRMIQNEAH